MRRRGVGRRSREACFYTGVAGGAGPAEVRAGEGKRSDWTREAAGSAVRRRPWRRARPGSDWRSGAGLTLPAGECRTVCVTGH